MAQIEQSDGGKKKKGAQKKMSIHVDFTPMVDMNMLLITFFMLCTTMIKSQTLSIALPAPPDENQTAENSETVGESTAVTLIIDTERDDNGDIVMKDGKPSDVIYYYFGFEPTIENGAVTEHKVNAERFVGNTSENGKTVQNGIRAILHERNSEVLAEIENVKNDWRAGKYTDEQAQQMMKDIKGDAKFESRPQVTIKATPQATWESVISALDEMQINAITQYRIGTYTPNDSLLIVDFKANGGGAE